MPVVTIKKAWLRVNTSPVRGGFGDVALSTKVGSRAETAQTSYTFFGYQSLGRWTDIWRT